MLKMYLNTKYFLQVYLNTNYIDVFKYFFILFFKYRPYSFIFVSGAAAAIVMFPLQTPSLNWDWNIYIVAI